MFIVTAMAVMLIGAATLATIADSAFADGYRKKYKSQASQANACGNGEMATNIFCQNILSQIQGEGNAVNIIGLQ